jgi:uncharacterized protein (TIGR02453 family)
MSFEGFSKEGITFFQQLATHQDRDWFKANKQRYQALWEEPLDALFEDLRPSLEKQFNPLKLEPPKVFRIYRDVRFSKDKSPFKTHVGGMIAGKGGHEAGAPAAVYLHLGLEESTGAGHWFFMPDKLVAFRKLVANDKTGAELQKKVEGLKKKGFSFSAMEETKRVPKGFEPDHPRAELLKLKGLGMMFPKIPASVRYSKKLAPWLLEHTALAAPLVTWLDAKL